MGPTAVRDRLPQRLNRPCSPARPVTAGAGTRCRGTRAVPECVAALPYFYARDRTEAPPQRKWLRILRPSRKRLLARVGPDANLSKANDALLPVWKASSAIYVSLYLPYKSGTDVSLARNQQYIDGVLTEASRVAELVQPPLPVVPYAWYRYHEGEPSGLQLLTKEDTNLEFVRPFARFPRVGPAIIWGEEDTPACANETVGWFQNNSAVFGAQTTEAQRGPSRQSTRDGVCPVAESRGLSAPRGSGHHPSFPADGSVPLPAWAGCGLYLKADDNTLPGIRVCPSTGDDSQLDQLLSGRMAANDTILLATLSAAQSAARALRRLHPHEPERMVEVALCPEVHALQAPIRFTKQDHHQVWRGERSTMGQQAPTVSSAVQLPQDGWAKVPGKERAFQAPIPAGVSPFRHLWRTGDGVRLKRTTLEGINGTCGGLGTCATTISTDSLLRVLV